MSDQITTSITSEGFRRYMIHFAESLSPELATALAQSNPDPEFQQRLDALAAKANEGQLSADEREEYESYVEAMDLVALMRIKAGRKTK